MFRALRLNNHFPALKLDDPGRTRSRGGLLIQVGRLNFTAANQHQQHHFLWLIETPAVLGDSSANSRPRLRQLTNATSACGP
jgi:hypothetical protein